MAAAIAAAIGLGWFVLPRIWPRPRPGLLELQAQARQQVQDDLAEPHGWVDLQKQPPSGTTGGSRYVRLPRNARWRYSKLGGVPAVVFDASLAGVKGALYQVPLAALRPSGGQLPASPSRPVFTQGYCTSVWREGNDLCLLVVEGDEQALRRLLRPMSSLAQFGPAERVRGEPSGDHRHPGGGRFLTRPGKGGRGMVPVRPVGVRRRG